MCFDSVPGTASFPTVRSSGLLPQCGLAVTVGKPPGNAGTNHPDPRGDQAASIGLMEAGLQVVGLIELSVKQVGVCPSPVEKLDSAARRSFFARGRLAW